jgi:hypothetical protein
VTASATTFHLLHRLLPSPIPSSSAYHHVDNDPSLQNGLDCWDCRSNGISFRRRSCQYQQVRGTDVVSSRPQELQTWPHQHRLNLRGASLADRRSKRLERPRFNDVRLPDPICPVASDSCECMHVHPFLKPPPSSSRKRHGRRITRRRLCVNRVRPCGTDTRLQASAVRQTSWQTWTQSAQTSPE